MRGSKAQEVFEALQFVACARTLRLNLPGTEPAKLNPLTQPLRTRSSRTCRRPEAVSRNRFSATGGLHRRGREAAGAVSVLKNAAGQFGAFVLANGYGGPAEWFGSHDLAFAPVVAAY